MTLQADAAAIGEAIEIAIWVVSFLAMLVAALIVYLMVRPPRHARRRERSAEPETLGAAEMVRMMDVMERRLDLIEREVGRERLGREDRFQIAGGEPVQKHDQDERNRSSVASCGNQGPEHDPAQADHVPGEREENA